MVRNQKKRENTRKKQIREHSKSKLGTYRVQHIQCVKRKMGLYTHTGIAHTYRNRERQRGENNWHRTQKKANF